VRIQNSPPLKKISFESAPFPVGCLEQFICHLSEIKIIHKFKKLDKIGIKKNDETMKKNL